MRVRSAACHPTQRTSSAIQRNFSRKHNPQIIAFQTEPVASRPLRQQLQIQLAPTLISQPNILPTSFHLQQIPPLLTRVQSATDALNSRGVAPALLEATPGLLHIGHLEGVATLQGSSSKGNRGGVAPNKPGPSVNSE